ncbi:MAG: hypothetical protein SGI72_05430 [Planctomycetota bacterium]|nr:hypothetical protein [Planctomycetota bacterium]
MQPGPVATRGPSVASLLALKWDYAVTPASTERQKADTHVKAARKALSREDALRALAGDDPRPLLVLRECSRCNKTDDALLQPGGDNEKVLFLARWFHCVRLPIDVVHPDHPFNAVFPGNDSEHLFVTSVDGALKRALESDTSRTELCTAMTTVLNASYAKDPSTLYKELHVFGDQLDALDSEKRDLEKQRAALMEARMLDKKKLHKVDQALEVVQKKITDKLSAIQTASKIDLKPRAKDEKKSG